MSRRHGTFRNPVEERDPAHIAIIHTRTHDHDAERGRDIDELTEPAIGVVTVCAIVASAHPPHVLVLRGRVGQGVGAGRFIHPLRGYDALAIPDAAVQIQQAEPGQVARPRVETALHFLEAMPLRVQAP